MAVFPASKYLNINNGHSAWRHFLVELALQLISFAEAAIEFKTGIKTVTIKRPSAHDLLEDEEFTPNFHHFQQPPATQTAAHQLNISTASTVPQPATPFANTAADSKTSAPSDDEDIAISFANQGSNSPTTPFDLPGLLPDYQFKYRHEPNSRTLTDAGYSDLRQDQKEWDNNLSKLQDKRRSLIEYILSICHPDSITALNNHPEFHQAVNDLDVAKIHHIITATHQQDNAVISLNNLYSFLHCTQSGRSLEEFGSDVKHKATSVVTEFEDPKHPGYIKTELLVNCVLLKGVDKDMSPLITNLLTSNTSKLRDMTSTSIMTSFRQFKNNTTANNQNRQTPNSNPNPNPTPKNHRPQPHTHTAALATPNTPPTKKETAYHFPNHPWSRPTVALNSVAPKGDPTKPYCPHCYQAGYISNHHGPHTTQPCFDHVRFEKDSAEAKRTPTSPTPTNTAWNQQAALARTQQAQTITQQATLQAALATPSGQAALAAAFMQGATSTSQSQIDQAALESLHTRADRAYRGDGADEHAAGGGGNY